MAGRPRLTDDQKATAKAARETAKAGVREAADRAEARAGAKNPPKAAPKLAAVPSGGNPELDREEKALFLQFLPEVKDLRDKLATAAENLKNRYKAAKDQGGFTKADFDTAIAVETAENEAKERAKIARSLKIAKLMGSSLGSQLDMFLEPDRTPLADRAFQEGETDAMQNIPARPSYDPSTEGHRRYLDGFHSVSEKRIKEGMGTLHPEIKADQLREARLRSEREAAQARDAEAFKEFDEEAAPSSGVSMTRSQFKAHLGTQGKDGTKH